MRSKNPERYDPLFWDVMEAACEGRVIDFTFDTEREARGWRTNYYAFMTAIEHAFLTNFRGLSERSRERLEPKRDLYGLTAAFLIEGRGIRIMLKALTPTSQALRAQFQAQDRVAEVRQDVADASAQAILDKLQTLPDAATPPDDASLGKKNPYY